MPGKNTPQVEVLVTVSDSHRSSISAVAASLKKAGLTSATTLGSAGIITGCVPTDSLDRLKSIAGVQAVERSGSVQIAPPDADVQ